MISIVSVSHGHSMYVYNLIESISEHLKGLTYEFILIDNLNEGYDFEGVFEKYSIENYSVIRNVRPYSFSYNNNIGVSLAKYEKLLLLNPDIQLKDGSLQKYFIEAEVQDGLFYPQLLNFDHSPQVHGKEKPSFLNQFITTCSSLFGVHRESPEGGYWFFAAAVICNKQFFYKLGGFDVDFPMYAEDVELCDRARKRGFLVERLSNVELLHDLGGDSKGKYMFKAIKSNIILRYKMYRNSKARKNEV